jgi:hypothetical protein
MAAAVKPAVLFAALLIAGAFAGVEFCCSVAIVIVFYKTNLLQRQV